MLTIDDVRRLDFGYFIRPATETATGRPRVEPVFGYGVPFGGGWLVFDTGLGAGDAEVDGHYRPQRRGMPAALASAGVGMDTVRALANCHLHFDHCGGNPLFAGMPIYTQAVELKTAESTDMYTLEHLIDFPRARYERLDGEVEVAPGIWLVPTPGHTQGHQSMVVRCGDGTVVVAGQAYDFASDYTAAHLALLARDDAVSDPPPEPAAWMRRLRGFDPRRVVFAHDMAVWEPS